MVSEKFMVNNDDGRLQAANYVAEDFAEQAKLSKRDMLRLCLLVEETLGMVKITLEDFFGQMWFVGDDRGCEIRLEVVSNMNSDKKHEMLSMSSTGDNAAAKGLMARIGDFVSRTMYSFGKAVDVYGAETMRCGIMNPTGIDSLVLYDTTPLWSLKQYRENLQSQRTDDADADDAWDELEKSIVGNLADDVVVGVKGDRVEMVIVKNFRQ